MVEKRQSRSVPWPEELRKPSAPAPIYMTGDTGFRDPKVLAADIRHAFFGSFNIGAEVLLGDLSNKLNRIHIDKGQVVHINREPYPLSEALTYRVKAQLFKVQKEHKDAERDKERERLKRFSKSKRPSGNNAQA